MWFIPEGDTHRLINIPFFVDNLAMEDLVRLKECRNGYYKIDQIVSVSSNSTLWIVLNKPPVGKDILEEIHKLGCGYEGGVFPGYFTVNVPGKIDINSVYAILDQAESNNVLLIDYPCIRQ